MKKRYLTWALSLLILNNVVCAQSNIFDKDFIKHVIARVPFEVKVAAGIGALAGIVGLLGYFESKCQESYRAEKKQQELNKQQREQQRELNMQKCLKWLQKPDFRESYRFEDAAEGENNHCWWWWYDGGGPCYNPYSEKYSQYGHSFWSTRIYKLAMPNGSYLNFIGRKQLQDRGVRYYATYSKALCLYSDLCYKRISLQALIEEVSNDYTDSLDLSVVRDLKNDCIRYRKTLNNMMNKYISYFNFDTSPWLRLEKYAVIFYESAEKMNKLYVLIKQNANKIKQKLNNLDNKEKNDCLSYEECLSKIQEICS
ncbi:MAG: hypothetical protein WD055_03005 [Candidatus Dependentiae bacterium]